MVSTGNERRFSGDGETLQLGLHATPALRRYHLMKGPTSIHTIIHCILRPSSSFSFVCQRHDELLSLSLFPIFCSLYNSSSRTRFIDTQPSHMLS